MTLFQTYRLVQKRSPPISNLCSFMLPGVDGNDISKSLSSSSSSHSIELHCPWPPSLALMMRPPVHSLSPFTTRERARLNWTRLRDCSSWDHATYPDSAAARCCRQEWRGHFMSTANKHQGGALETYHDLLGESAVVVSVVLANGIFVVLYWHFKLDI